jgi:hypothetical protein
MKEVQAYRLIPVNKTFHQFSYILRVHTWLSKRHRFWLKGIKAGMRNTTCHKLWTVSRHTRHIIRKYIKAYSYYTWFLCSSIYLYGEKSCRSQWSRGKSVGFGGSLAGIVGSKPAGLWVFVCCERCVLSGRGFVTSRSLVQRSPT